MRIEQKIRELYTFDELDAGAKERALESLADINVSFDWWDAIYDDALEIGLNITGFDTYRGDIDGELTLSLRESTRAILENHGETCDTYKLAKQYLHRTGENNEEEYLRELLEQYLSILRQEYDDAMSVELIEETILDNGYEFTKEGELA